MYSRLIFRPSTATTSSDTFSSCLSAMAMYADGEREAGKGRRTLTGSITTQSAVPQSDTGGLVEKTKVNELTLVKELGNKASVT